MDFLTTGGVVVGIELAMGAAAAVIFIERMLHLRRAGVDAADFLNGIRNLLDGGKHQEALSLCDDARGPAASVARAVIANRGKPPDILRECAEAAGNREAAPVERRLSLLAAFAQTAPLLGLLGTVAGVAETLGAMNARARLVQSADLTSGVMTALGTTAFGLGVAIFCHILHSALLARSDRLITDMERAASEMLVYFAPPAKGDA